MKVIKTVNYDKFEINDNLKLSEVYIGNTGSKIVKIDNFFKHPEFIREYALNAYYIDEHNLNGLGTGDSKTHWYTHRFSMDFDKYAHFFDKVKSEIFYDQNIHYSIHPSHYNFQYYDKMGPNVPHTDPTHYAGILSLNYEDEMEGTGSCTRFHRLKKTGEEITLNGTYRAVRPDQTPSDGFECYYKIPHNFNTLFMYEARLFHSAYCDYSKWTSDIKRLTFNCFTW